tara:strand:- start:2650 stop:2898 length:249 start_codon:yes stop_codon:yes gene_type:complete
MVGEYVPITKEQANELAYKILDRFNKTLKPNEYPRKIIDIMAIYVDWGHPVTSRYGVKIEQKETKISIFTGKRELNIFKTEN